MQPLREIVHPAMFPRIALPQGPRRHTHLRVQAAAIEGSFLFTMSPVHGCLSSALTYFSLILCIVTIEYLVNLEISLYYKLKLKQLNNKYKQCTVKLGYNEPLVVTNRLKVKLVF
jgi:hypothetical protein